MNTDQNIDLQPGADMPRQIAMWMPHPRVVGDKAHHHVSWHLDEVARPKDKGILPHRVLQIGDAIPLTHALNHDSEIVPVQMNWNRMSICCITVGVDGGSMGYNGVVKLSGTVVSPLAPIVDCNF